MVPSLLKLGIKYDLGSGCTFYQESRLFWYLVGGQNEPQSFLEGFRLMKADRMILFPINHERKQRWLYCHYYSQGSWVIGVVSKGKKLWSSRSLVEITWRFKTKAFFFNSIFRVIGLKLKLVVLLGRSC